MTLLYWNIYMVTLKVSLQLLQPENAIDTSVHPSSCHMCSTELVSIAHLAIHQCYHYDDWTPGSRAVAYNIGKLCECVHDVCMCVNECLKFTYYWPKYFVYKI